MTLVHKVFTYPPVDVVLLEDVQKVADVERDGRTVHRRVVVQRAVVHHVRPDGEGHRFVPGAPQVLQSLVFGIAGERPAGPVRRVVEVVRVEGSHVGRVGHASVAVVRVRQRELGGRVTRLGRTLTHQVLVGVARVDVSARMPRGQTARFVSGHHNVEDDEGGGCH